MYDELLKVAAEAVRKVKEERDSATESKLEGPPLKRPRRDSERRYDTQPDTTNTCITLAHQVPTATDHQDRPGNTHPR